MHIELRAHNLRLLPPDGHSPRSALMTNCVGKTSCLSVANAVLFNDAPCGCCVKQLAFRWT